MQLNIKIGGCVCVKYVAGAGAAFKGMKCHEIITSTVVFTHDSSFSHLKEKN